MIIKRFRYISTADDEEWMHRFDVPRLHSIFDSYMRIVKKTKWMEKIGKALQSKLLRSVLTSTIKRHSSSSKYHFTFGFFQKTNFEFS